MSNSNNPLIPFIKKKISQGNNIIVIGRDAFTRDFPVGVHRLTSLNEDPTNILELTCGKKRRIFVPNLSESEIDKFDAFELHCSGALISNGTIWLKKHPLFSNDRFNQISKVKCFVAHIYENDIYESIPAIELKWGNNVNEDLFVTSDIHLKSESKNMLFTLRQTVVIYLSAY